jgi:hypothetical protein
LTVWTRRLSYCDTTSNPTFGCNPVSTGSDHCYAEAVARRFQGGFALRLKPHRRQDVRRFHAIAAPDGEAGAAVWFKALGRWDNHPRWPEARGRTQAARKADLVARGLELLPAEHGGATLDGRLIQALPRVYGRLAARL